MGFFLANDSQQVENRISDFSAVGPKTHTPVSPMKDRGHRFYNPEIGRWVSRDPIQENGGLSLYGFCANNPATYADYNGLIVGSIQVTNWEKYNSGNRRGWLFTVVWKPPTGGDWDKPCTDNCRPCKKAIWIQWAERQAHWHGALDEHFPWNLEVDGQNYGSYGNAWSCGGNNAGFGDMPSAGVWKYPFGSLQYSYFIARTCVKCIEGKDAGAIYGCVEWGYSYIKSRNPQIVGHGYLIQ